MKKCPFCAEEIKDEAKVCKHCKTSLVNEIKKPSNNWSVKKIFKIALLILVIYFVFWILRDMKTVSDFNNAKEQLNRNSCLETYANKPQFMIEAECLKYFNK